MAHNSYDEVTALQIYSGGSVAFANDVWHGGRNAGDYRFAFNTNGTTFHRGYGTSVYPMVFKNGSDADIFKITNAGGCEATAHFLSYNGQVYARNGFDVLLHADGGQMAVCFGNIGTSSYPTYLKIGAFGGHTFIQSNQARHIYFEIYSGTFNGTYRMWEFAANAGAFNAANSTTWNQRSDQRIKENIVKADLKTCYDNVKNINLYRYNYIDRYQKTSQDKNKLGYIAQEVKRHFNLIRSSQTIN
jgi:hypothetical protein